MEIRPAARDDIRSVLALWKEADSEPSHTDDVRSFDRLMSHDQGALLVAVEHGRVVGSVIAAWDGWRGSIYRLAVAPDYRRQGLAQRLLDASEARLASRGAIRLQAIVVETHEHATGCWPATSWEEQTQRLRFVKG